jgi:hypothetical protein
MSFNEKVQRFRVGLDPGMVTLPRVEVIYTNSVIMFVRKYLKNSDFG